MSEAGPGAAAIARGWIDASCRLLTHAWLAGVRGGSLVIEEGGRQRHFGDSGQPVATLHVRRSRFHRRVVFSGSLGAAESYMDGDWEASDLTALLTLLARQIDRVDELDTVWTRLAARAARRAHARRENTPAGSRANVEAHYDLGNEFFETFLDPTMTYSCGIFERPDSTLEEASRSKLRRLCERLELGATDHVLEIGTGWGSFALEAGRLGCRVTTTTLSREQAAWARARVAAAGLGDRVTVLEKDYRELQGTFDKILSIEMIEAVGHAYLPSYFQACARLLAPHGTMALQAITLCERHHAGYLDSVDFIRRHVFPGGCLPSLSSLAHAIDGTGLAIRSTEEIGPHYARTLAAWRERFLAARSRLAASGRTERFLRMWEYYLCTCEAGFEARTTGTVQMVLAHGGRRGIGPGHDRERVTGS